MTLRPPEDDDFDAILELMNAHQLAAFGEADQTEDELRTWLTSPSVEVERDIRVLEQDGPARRLRRRRSEQGDPPLWWCDLKLAPDVDADAIAAELVGWLEERADAGRLRVWTSATDARVVSAVERLGFAPVRHSYRMEIDLAGEAAEPVWPDGISVRTLAEGEERRVFDAFVEVWQDTLGPTRRDLRGVEPLADPGGDLRAIAVVPRSRRRRARRDSRSAGRTPPIRLRDTSSCSVSGAPGASRVSARRCCCTRSRSSGGAAGRVARSASTRRARPERPGCTSGRECASTGTRCSSNARRTSKVRACRASAPAALTAEP